MNLCSFNTKLNIIKYFSTILLFIVISFFSCTDDNILESKQPPAINPHQPPETVLLEPAEFQTLAINDFQIDVYQDGALEKGIYVGNGSSKGLIYLGGLWVGAYQNGIPKGNIAWTGSNPRSNFTSLFNNKYNGVYYLQKGDVNNIPLNYPFDKGAPVDKNGNPVRSALKSDSSYSSPTILSKPLDGFLVNHTVYAFEGGGLKT